MMDHFFQKYRPFNLFTIEFINIKFIIFEFFKMWSSEKSFFSSKRVERSILFLSAIYIVLFITHRYKFEMTELMGLVVLILGAAGWNMHVTEKTKRLNLPKQVKKEANDPE